jgi:hypothetical protein
MSDAVILQKSLGEASEELRASVQGSIAFVEVGRLAVEIGDTLLLRRETGSSTAEVFEICRSELYRQSGLPGYYRVRIRRQTTSSCAKTKGCVDVSPSAVALGFPNAEEIVALLREVRTALNHCEIDEGASTRILAAIRDIENAADLRTFEKRYREVLAVIADHISVLSPAISGLGRLFG